MSCHKYYDSNFYFEKRGGEGEISFFILTFQNMDRHLGFFGNCLYFQIFLRCGKFYQFPFSLFYVENCNHDIITLKSEFKSGLISNIIYLISILQIKWITIDVWVLIYSQMNQILIWIKFENWRETYYL